MIILTPVPTLVTDLLVSSFVILGAAGVSLYCLPAVLVVGVRVGDKLLLLFLTGSVF